MKEAAPRAATALALAAIVAGAFWLRVVPPSPQVFRGDRVVLLSNDPWAHARQVDEILRHFPRPSERDAQRLFPDGQANEAPLFPLTIATAAWLLGAGAPKPDLVDRVLAFAPAILGALVVLPVYALGRRLFSRPAGLLAAAIVAILPGQFLQRSLLGYTDHHVAECLLSLLVFASLTAALDASGKRRDVWSLVAGVWLGAYLLTWARGMLLPLALALWALVQILVEHGRERRTPARSILGRAFAVALVLVLPVAGWAEMRNVPPSLVASAAAVFAAAALSRTVASRGGGRAAFAGAAAAAALLGLLLTTFVQPRWTDDMVALVRRLAPRAATATATIAEARPLLYPNGPFSAAPVWTELTTSSLLGAAGLLLLAARTKRERRPADALLLVWSLVALGLTLAQVRFGYYLAPVAALLAAGAVARLTLGLAAPFSVVAALCLAVYPALRPGLATASAPQPGPSPDWVATLDWVRTATPQDRPYGVLAWCDYGYWITRIAQRAPVANPTQHGATEVARALLETDDAEARRQIDALGARYLILDRALLPEVPDGSGVTRLGLLDTLARWAGKKPSDYYEILFEKDEGGRLRAAVVYTPAYYRTLLARLYTFRGRAAASTESLVVETGPGKVAERDVQVITHTRQFPNADEAQAAIDAEPGRRLRIVGRHPFRPSVDIAETTGYELVHATDAARIVDGRPLPDILVFEVGRLEP